MSENKRFKELIDFLISTKKVRNQQQFVEEIRSDSSSVSLIKNDRVKIPKDMFVRISDAYPFVSIEWLKSGEGEMLRTVPPKQPEALSPTVERLLDLLREKDCQISEKDRQIDRILTLLENQKDK